MGKDYIDRVTESQSEVGAQAAEWLVKTLHGKGNIIMFGGTPGNPMTAAQVVGWRPVFAKYPGIKVLEAEPVPTMWDPAVAQQKTAALIAKYPQIDGIYSETVGPIRAFVAAGRPIPAYVGQSLMDLSCHHGRASGDEDDEHRCPHLDGADALAQGCCGRQGMDKDEPSLVKLPISEDTTSKDPKLALKCDKSMPMDSIPSSMLTQAATGQGAGRQVIRLAVCLVIARSPMGSGRSFGTVVHLRAACCCLMPKVSLLHIPFRRADRVREV